MGLKAVANPTLGGGEPGNFTTLSASSTVTLSPANANVTISPTGTGTVTINPATAGTLNNVAIGQTTPAAGAFTTLSASSTVSGTGFSTYLASPPAIGGTVAAAGTFTVATATTAFRAADGSAATPSLSFTNATSTGLYVIAASGGDINFSAQGVNVARITAGSGALNLLSTAAFGWSSGDPTAAANDVTLVRDGGAGLLALKLGAAAQTFRVYGTTTGPKYASFGHDGTNAVIDTAASSGLLSIAPTNATSVSIGKKISSYNGQATAGVGVVIVVAAPRQAGVTNQAQSLTAFTVGAADSSFEVSANVLVTTATTHSFTVTCTYTSEDNVSRVITFSFEQLAGSLTTIIVNTNGAVPYEGIPLHIRCKANTTITIASAAGGTYTNVVYNLEGIIKQTA